MAQKRIKGRKDALRTLISLAAMLFACGITFGDPAYSQRSGDVFSGSGTPLQPSREAPSLAPETLAEIESLEKACFNEVNRLRSRQGLELLEVSESLLPVARDYSRRMALEGFFSHTDPEGRSVRERVSEAGIRWQVLGENLAYSNGYVNPVAAALRGWMNSSGHRRNILSPDFRAAAVGAWIGRDNTVYFTEIFLR